MKRMIHAAIVCASTSCPSLRREPFRAASIDAQLDDALRTFLADTRKGLAVDRGPQAFDDQLTHDASSPSRVSTTLPSTTATS